MTKTYKDFTSLFNEILYDILNNVSLFIENKTGNNYYLYPLIIKCFSNKCELNLGDFYYTINKMKYLINKYVDLNDLKEFKEKLKKSKGTALTFYFKTKKPKQGTTSDNGPCLLNIVLTRPSRKIKWNRCFINYRITELNRRFGADLIFFNKFINELPECCNVEEIFINLPISYLNFRYLATQIPWEYLDPYENMHKRLLNTQNKMKVNNYSSYKSTQRAQKIIRGEKKKNDIDLSNFKILEEEK